MQLKPGLSSKALLQTRHQIPIQLHRLHRGSWAGEQLRREGSAPRPHLQHMVIGLQRCSRDDPLQHALILEPVLAKAFARVMSRKGHDSNCASAQMLQRKPAHLALSIHQR